MIKTKYIILIITILTLFGCGSSDNLTAFSKRKYLKKSPKQKKIEQTMPVEAETYAAANLNYETYLIDEIPAIDDSEIEPVEVYIKLDNVILAKRKTLNPIKKTLDYRYHLINKINNHKQSKVTRKPAGDSVVYETGFFIMLALGFLFLIIALILEFGFASSGAGLFIVLSLLSFLAARKIWKSHSKI